MKVEVYEDSAGEYRWRMKARNGRIIASSGEGFNNKHACETSLELVEKAFYEIREARKSVA